jgi:hypothetical protein
MWSMLTAPTPWCIPSFQGADSAFDITFLFIFQTPVAHCDHSHFTYWAQTLKPLLFWIGTVNQLQMPQSNHLKRLSQQGDLCRPGCTASPLSYHEKKVSHTIVHRVRSQDSKMHLDGLTFEVPCFRFQSLKSAALETNDGGSLTCLWIDSREPQCTISHEHIINQKPN